MNQCRGASLKDVDARESVFSWFSRGQTTGVGHPRGM